jgi:hypothetical protein
MVHKEAIRWEHLEAYKEKRFDEIPAHLLEEVKTRVEGVKKAETFKGKKLAVEVDIAE